MNLHFSIPYRAQWGEDVCVELILYTNRQREHSRLLRMETQDGYVWQTEFRTSDASICQFSYRYVVCWGEKVVRREWARVPRLFDSDKGRDFYLDDFWIDTPLRPWLFDVDLNPEVAGRKCEDIHTPSFAQTLLLRVMAPTLAVGEAVALLGSQPPIGEWKPERALRLMATGRCEWRLALSTTALHYPFEYKYVVVDEKTGELLRWEEGDNRICNARNVPEAPDAAPESKLRLSRQGLTTIVRNDGLLREDENAPHKDVEARKADERQDVTDIEADKEEDKDVNPLTVILELAHKYGVKAVNLETLDDMDEVYRRDL